MSKEWEPQNVFDVLGNEEARKIVALANVRPRSAQELAKRCDISLPTVYRRVNALLDYDLLKEEARIDEDGNHYSIFHTALESATVKVDDGRFHVDVRLRGDIVDQFQQFWEDLERSSARDDPDDP